MKYTLLELVQTVLSSMDSDAVNSIGDSVESMQVAKVIRTAYFDIINRANLPKHFALKNLTPSTDGTKPILMYIPTDVAEILEVKYDNATIIDTATNMQLVKFQPLDEFLDAMDMMNLSDSNVASTTYTSPSGDTYKLTYRTDKAPQYYTTFDDYTLIFDSYDKSVDSTLQSSKTRAYCKLLIPFTMADTFIPELDDVQFALLLSEAKSLAWTELKQSPHPKAEQSAKRGWSYLNKTKFESQKISDFNELPNFGRAGRGFRTEVLVMH